MRSLKVRFALLLGGAALLVILAALGVLGSIGAAERTIDRTLAAQARLELLVELSGRMTQYGLADFAKIWNGIALAIASADDVARPAYDLAGDWGPWSRAPMESGGLRVAASELTNDLPPIYQITEQIRIDAPVGSVR